MLKESEKAIKDYGKPYRRVFINRKEVIILSYLAIIFLKFIYSIFKKGIQNSIEYLHDIGYQVETIEINANEYGVAQKRKRHLLLGYSFLVSDSIEKQLLMKKMKALTLKDVIGDIEDEFKSKEGIFYTPSIMKKENIKIVSIIASYLNNVFLFDTIIK